MIYVKNKKSVQNIFLNLILLTLVIITIRCAKMGDISGGPKDLDPPKMLGSDPPNNTTNFKKNKIRIDFDEYIQITNVTQQFNASPPFKKKPTIWLKNKSVVIQYTDTLKDSTTYTLNFGNGIADNNEGNILPNFEFVFSTGNYLDSLVIRGKIENAFTLKPDKDSYLAMLHTNLSDSAPYKETPMYTGRSDDNGYFSINNIKPGKYRLYALKDKNSNYKYDSKTEFFAFFDTIIDINPAVIKEKADPKVIFPQDTLSAWKDTAHKKIFIDSTKLKRNRNSLYYDLFSFREKDCKQYIKSNSRKQKRLINLGFNNKLKNDSVILTPVYIKAGNWYQIEKTERHDSILIWITDTNLIKTDTLKTKISYWGTNKKGDTVWTSDTLNFRFVSTENTEKKVKKQRSDSMNLSWPAGGSIDLNAEPYIEAQFPLTKLNKEKIQLLQRVDTVEFPVKFEVVKDTFYPRRAIIKSKWIEQTSYRLIVIPGAFENIYGLRHDTLKVSFSTQKIDYYGKLTFILTKVHTPIIVQLLDNDRIAYEKYMVKDGNLVFDYLQPTQYILKVIFDSNRDKEWTTGDLLKKRLPEKVIFYKENINVRSNWDSSIEWDLK